MRSSWILVTWAVCLLPPVLVADNPERKVERRERLTELALRAQTVSGPSPQAVTTPASFSLKLDGDMDLGGYVFQGGVAFIHNDGGAYYANTAVGLNALVSLTPGFGEYGGRNTAHGYRALYSNSTGAQNTAVGAYALINNTSGPFNTAVGVSAMINNTSGMKNTAIGSGAGSAWYAGEGNIAIGAGAYGVYNDSEVIRIGGNNYQTTTFIEGISGTEVVGDPVCITVDDQLGVCPQPRGVQTGLSQISPQLWEQLRRQDAELAALRKLVADQRRRLEQLERER